MNTIPGGVHFEMTGQNVTEWLVVCMKLMNQI